MEPETLHAPPVVAVVVVHEPGDWFEQTLDSLAAQDYPNLRFLFLIAEPSAVAQAEAAALSSGSGDSGKVAFEAHLETVIKLRIPKAFVRSLGANPGFGAAANEVGRLVEGQNGFFLFCHDDIAPEPDAVRLLVEELYRSNAGVVGPKLVEWDDPGVLQTVGLGLDRFGELHQPIEPGEIDQEQHDGVRDVFVLPSACLLVRADLFREIGGFDPAIDFWGDDIEFCWRVHHSGARVVVAPVARVRHRGRLVERRPDVAHLTAQARHRMRTVVTMTGRARLPGRLVELVLLTLSELVVGLFTGRFRSAIASTRGLIGLVPRSAGIVRRRREVAATRRVPEREVLGLQERGSARLSSFLRNRDMSTFVGAESSVRRWRESTTAPVFVWMGVLAALLFGSRAFITGGVPSVGEFLPFVDSPRDLFSSYASGWSPNGLGSTSANPTGWATLSVLSTITLFRMGLLQTVFVIGLVVVGLVGLWKLASVFPSSRARLGALLVYAASPLVSGALAIGSLSTLVSYAAAPWIVHTLRNAVGVGTADPRLAEADLVDGIVELDLADRIRKMLQVGLVVGLATAFVPVMLIVSLVIGVLLAAATLLAMAPWRTALRYLEASAAGAVVAVLLNLPWITTWSWSELVGPSPVGDPGRGLVELASFEIGPTDFVSLWLVLYLPVVAAIVLARAWRLTWAIRAGVLVAGFGALAVLGDRDALPLAMPEAGVLLAPIGVGLAVSAAAALAAFDLDVRGGTFGWRQPLGLVASAAVLVGLVPGIYATGDGGWQAPTTTLAALVDLRLPDADQAGDYHVLVLGDARILPTPGVEYRDGMSFSVIDDDGMDVRDRWSASSTRGDAVIAEALDRIASGSTQRAGRLLAPLGIRFVIIPLFDGVISTPANPLEPPAGLQTALDEQLDIVSFPDLPTVDIYQNTAWLPTASLLSGATAEASTAAGDEALVRADLTAAEPAFVGVDHTSPQTQEISAGVVHLAVPFDGNWTLSVDGVDIDGRRAFGITTAFDVPTGGEATLEYDSSSTRSLWVALQVALWLIVVVGAARVAVPSSRRRLTAIEDETLISLDDDAVLPAESGAAFDPGLDLTGQVARVGVDPDPDEMPDALLDGMTDALPDGMTDALPDGTAGAMAGEEPLRVLDDERVDDEREVER